MLVQSNDPVGGLVGEHHRPRMVGQPGGKADLIVPTKAALSVLGKGDVVRRVGVDEIIGVQGQRLEILAREVPGGERRLIVREVGAIGDGLVPPKRYIELTTAIKAAETVVAGAVEIVEQLGGRGAVCATMPDQGVELLPVPVKKLRLIAHGQRHR